VLSTAVQQFSSAPRAIEPLRVVFGSHFLQAPVVLSVFRPHIFIVGHATAIVIQEVLIVIGAAAIVTALTSIVNAKDRIATGAASIVIAFTSIVNKKDRIVTGAALIVIAFTSIAIGAASISMGEQPPLTIPRPCQRKTVRSVHRRRQPPTICCLLFPQNR
jgi:hypothetical protein